MSSPTSTTESSESPLQAARRLGPLAAERAPRTELNRALEPELLEALRRAGLFGLCVPRTLGGRESEPAELLATIEQLARADGSAAWCVMVGATTSLLSAYLPQAEARTIYGDPHTITAGVVAPRGCASAEGDGMRLSGRWPFASGVGASSWIALGCVIDDGEGPRQRPDGSRDVRLCLLPVADVRVIDTWTVSGLRGTGSHDVQVSDTTVPAARVVSLHDDRPWPAGPLYAFPLFGLLALGIAAVAVGIARGALDDVVELAAGKTPTGGARTLAQRPTVQAEVARAESELRAARALLQSAVAEAWSSAAGGEALSIGQRLGLRLAATHATQAAANTVDTAYRVGGASSIFESSALQRRFRDVHVATAHMMVAPSTLELEGRLLLGLPTDVSQL